jgi:hypothetical protein
MLAVLALLPADARARCAAVSRGWRATLTDAGAWTRLDLSPASGVARRRTDALLLAAAARAGGGLLALNITDCPEVTYDTLLAVLRANPGFSELHCCRASFWSAKSGSFCDNYMQRVDVLEVLREAPQLRLLAADLVCDSAAEAAQVLSNEPPFTAVRVRHLEVGTDEAMYEEAAAGMLALAAAMATHDSLQAVDIINDQVHTLGVLDALVDAALACRLRRFALLNCGITPACAPALARLLRGGTLQELEISDTEVPLLTAASAAALGDALHGNTALASFKLHAVDFWADSAAAATLLRGVAHSRVRVLSLPENEALEEDQQAAAGAALGELIAANCASLHELEVNDCALGDAGLAPLADALPLNTHLRVLECMSNEVSEECARLRLLPAVHANSSLRMLSVRTDALHGALCEAEAVVRQRRRAMDAAAGEAAW